MIQFPELKTRIAVIHGFLLDYSLVLQEGCLSSVEVFAIIIIENEWRIHYFAILLILFPQSLCVFGWRVKHLRLFILIGLRS